MLQQSSPSTPLEVSLSAKRKLVKQSTREHMKLFVTVYHSLKEATSHGIVSHRITKARPRNSIGLDFLEVVQGGLNSPINLLLKFQRIS